MTIYYHVHCLWSASPIECLSSKGEGVLTILFNDVCLKCLEYFWAHNRASNIC